MGAPLFVHAGKHDYHLGAGSPAIDKVTTVALTQDHDGLSRPQGAAFDIGAYERAP